MSHISENIRDDRDDSHRSTEWRPSLVQQARNGRGDSVSLGTDALGAKSTLRGYGFEKH